KAKTIEELRPRRWLLVCSMLASCLLLLLTVAHWSQALLHYCVRFGRVAHHQANLPLPIVHATTGTPKNWAGWTSCFARVEIKIGRYLLWYCQLFHRLSNNLNRIVHGRVFTC